LLTRSVFFHERTVGNPRYREVEALGHLPGWLDERDPQNRVYRMQTETAVDVLRRKIGRHPAGCTPDDKPNGSQLPVLNLHWRIDGSQTA
jgi:hypothetical protein